MANSPHLRNTWDCLEKIKQEHAEDLKEKHSRSSGLEEAYLSAHGERNAMLMEKHGDDDRTTLKQWQGSPLDAFLGLIKNGGYPPPELLLLVAEAFEYYFQRRGSVSLEHVFFGREVPNVGNESARRRKNFVFQMYTSSVRDNRRNGKKLTQIEIAEKIIKIAKKYHIVDPKFVDEPESFIRSWRRWKKSDK